jgi:ketosteroid isomerase-like protein
MKTKRIYSFAPLLIFFLCLQSGILDASQLDTERLQQQVDARERSFAQSMADRDFEAFVEHLSEEAVFFGSGVSRGISEVAAAWKPLFDGDEAPFSWEPEKVQVLDSGNLALSTGPVRNSSGVIFSYYTSIWRQESPGVWKIIFDKGNKACPEDATDADK